MKKLIVAASLLAASFGAYAQDYKPVAGNVTAELGLFAGGVLASPLSLSSTTNPALGVPQLKFRYFLADQLALRAGINISKSTETDRVYEGAPGSGTGFLRTNSSLFALNLGIEKHFAGTERLSTYAGADLTLVGRGASQKYENTTDGTTYTADYERKRRGTNGTDNAGLGFGARVVAGADYYFVEKVYIGGEFGWGFVAFKEGKVKDETTLAGTTTTVETKSAGGEFNLTPLLTAGFRLGYRF